MKLVSVLTCCLCTSLTYHVHSESILRARVVKKGFRKIWVRPESVVVL